MLHELELPLSLPAGPLLRPGRYVVFDLETTGMRPDQDEIIQIAASRINESGDLIEAPFFSYVNPGRRIPGWITFYTGITDADVANAPAISHVLPEFSRYVADNTLIAHNGHRFDMRFLAECCRRCRLPERQVAYHDSLALSWSVWGRRGKRHGLDAVLNRLQINTTGHRRHDARSDVELLARAIQIMVQLSREKAGFQPRVKRYQGLIPGHVD